MAAIKNRQYILKDKKPVQVAETTLPDGKWVSTVFMGRDYNFLGDEPRFFETMVFEGKGLEKMNELDRERYSIWEEAEAGHKRMVDKWKKR